MVFHRAYAPRRLTHSFVSEHLSGRQVLAAVENAALSTGTQISLQSPVFISLVIYLKLGLPDPVVGLFFCSEGVSVFSVGIEHPASRVHGSRFRTPSPALVPCRLGDSIVAGVKCSSS